MRVCYVLPHTLMSSRTPVSICIMANALYLSMEKHSAPAFVDRYPHMYPLSRLNLTHTL